MKILLLQPNLRFAKIIETSLHKNKDTVDITQSTNALLQFLEKKEYQGVIIDSATGIKELSDTIHKIRKTKENLPIMLLVTRENESTYRAEFGTHIDSYTDTSTTEEGFLSEIRLITRRERKTKTDIVTFGNVSLHKSAYRIATPYGSCNVSQKEFLLLEILFDSQGRNVPTDTIKEKIWSTYPKLESNVVWTYFTYIRRKLTSIQANVDIKSTRFLGYALIIK